MSATIVCQKGPRAGESFALDDKPLTFGRSPDNRVVLAESLVSRHHAEIHRAEKGYFLTDLQSPNGTWVNGERLKQKVLLQPGSIIGIGGSVFQFQGPVPAARPVPVTEPNEIPTVITQGVARATGPEPRVVCIQGSQNGSVFMFQGQEMTFGRNTTNQVVLSDNRSSRRHAVILKEGAMHVLYDLGSQNGTLVNGERLTHPRPLKPGDRISISGEVFLFLVEVENPPPGMPANPPALVVRANPKSQALEYGIRCPGPCGQSWPLDMIHCPVDGYLLANGNSLILSSYLGQYRN